MAPEPHFVAVLVIAAAAFFWIGMIGLLWRRSLIGMMVGVLFAWLSVSVSALGFVKGQVDRDTAALGGTLVLCASILCCLQLAVGLSIVVARIRRRGTLDADDAGLLEG